MHINAPVNAPANAPAMHPIHHVNVSKALESQAERDKHRALSSPAFPLASQEIMASQQISNDGGNVRSFQIWRLQKGLRWKSSLVWLRLRFALSLCYSVSNLMDLTRSEKVASCPSATCAMQPEQLQSERPAHPSPLKHGPDR